MSEQYTVGVDFGTLSGRAVLVRVQDGQEVASAVHDYTHAVMTDSLPGGPVLPPEWALQHPQDYLDVLGQTIPAVLRQSGIDPDQIIGVGIDFTACTVLPTTRDGTPLCFLPQWEGTPHAYVKLWRHHAAQPQADRINAVAEQRGERWLPRYGGKISAEWAIAKLLQILEEAPQVYAAAERFLEATDWVTWQLCGAEVRNVCTAGYKAIYQDGEYPSPDYLAALNPDFRDAINKFSRDLHPLGDRAGSLTEAAARLTGLNVGTAVAVGNVDAHVTAPAVGATRSGQLVAIMGTSTCHVMIGDTLAEVPGMCGVVAGGITPGTYGYEAGQNGVGDLFGWVVKKLTPPEYHTLAQERGLSVHELLTELGNTQAVGEHGLLALDWLSGNRSVLVDTDLSGMIMGLGLSTRAEDIYRALIEATAFGTRVIVETFNASGVPVREFIAAGGLIKNPVLMQTYADVLGLPISIAGSSQAPALGSAMHAAVAAGAYLDIQSAADGMAKVTRAAYTPDAARHAAYTQVYQLYKHLHDLFGREDQTMKTLKRLREDAVSRKQRSEVTA
ncbi:ribulokinase [Deinococcus marmoris]|uniref:Ribulokinase n=1 Tax=Deinococcus marmoris TaxID=249408 RepID=A0A1U7NWF2_9DEIO|nr:ribulokinase [Deinococcus marmoris]OLV17236.1 Ribulokinase [Deinococcus marmoris]OLV18703.1 Ribulokinase [Deinococcus marmoris]